MPRPHIKNVEQVRNQINNWMRRATLEAERVARGLGSELLTKFVENSPQWSGDFASNWRYSLNVADMTYDTGDVPDKSGPTFEPWQQFSRPAVQLGLAKNRGKDLRFKLGDTIYISNASTHDTTYAKGVYDGTVKLREVNRVVALRSVVADFNATFGRPLDAAHANYLARKLI